MHLELFICTGSVLAMSKLQWFDKLSQGDLKKLVESVDTVLFDIDGTLLRSKQVYPCASDCVAKFRTLGKKIGFVTNNSVFTLDHLRDVLKPVELSVGEIITPYVSLLDYLEKTGAKGDIYVICGTLVKKLLKNAGYNVIEYSDVQQEPLAERIGGANGLKQLKLKTLETCKNVRIVYLDVDINFQYGDVQVAQVILNHISDVKLLGGMTDDVSPVDEESVAVCSKFYIDAIERWTKKKAIKLSKPSEMLTELVISKFGITDRSRVLVIGDSISADITFGVNAGFKTCIVLSGITKKDQIERWEFPEILKPDFVANSVEEIFRMIEHL